MGVPVVTRRAGLQFHSVNKTASLMSFLSMVFMSVIHRILLSMRVPRKMNPKVVLRISSSMRAPEKLKTKAILNILSDMRVLEKTNPRAILSILSSMRVLGETNPEAIYRNSSSMRVPQRLPLNANVPARYSKDEVDRSPECVLH